MPEIGTRELSRGAREMLVRRGIFVSPSLVQLVVGHVLDHLSLRPRGTVLRSLDLHRVMARSRPARTRLFEGLADIYPKVSWDKVKRGERPETISIRRVSPVSIEDLGELYSLEEEARARGQRRRAMALAKVIQELRP